MLAQKLVFDNSDLDKPPFGPGCYQSNGQQIVYQISHVSGYFTLKPFVPSLPLKYLADAGALGNKGFPFEGSTNW
jgi:hypothetical protein